MDNRHVELKIEGDSVVEIECPVDAIHKIEHHLKRKYFGDGEWVHEPDYAEFHFHGINCKIKRIYLNEGRHMEHTFGGHFCGYCRIPEDHKLYGNIDDYPEFEVHGGITYNDMHLDQHWIGFDCAHSFDVVPSMQKIERDLRFEKLFPLPDDWPRPTYKNFNFVLHETRSLAEQVKNYV